MEQNFYMTYMVMSMVVTELSVIKLQEHAYYIIFNMRT